MGDAIEKQQPSTPASVNPALDALKAQASALSKSDLMPQAYRNNGPNCLLAMEIANRIGAGVFQVAQNLHIIHGKPSWSSTFLIATVNASGRWTPLKFQMVGDRGAPDWGCYAYASDKDSGERCDGPVVDMRMAKAEGWSTKKGSKWETMPELMLRYRAAAFWSRLYAPELAMGIHTTDEVQDMSRGRAMAEVPAELVPGDSQDLEAALLGKKVATVEHEAPDQEHDPETGELSPEEETAAFGGQAS